MKHADFGRRILALAAATLVALAASAQAQAPAPAPAAVTGAAAATPADPAASNPAAVLPRWAQDKLAAVKADRKLYDQAYRHGEKLSAFCANCHGPKGLSVKPEVPNLAGQNTVYVLDQLTKFRDGRRTGAFFMVDLVKAMSDEERFAVAVFFTAQLPPVPQPLDPVLALKGKTLYEKGCRKCHGDDGEGSEKNSRIAGQHPVYLEKSIRRYRENSERASDKMLKYTKSLSDGDIKALAAYISQLK